jgi:hypothetical protein
MPPKAKHDTTPDPDVVFVRSCLRSYVVRGCVP